MRLIDADNALELFRVEYRNTENLIKQGEKQLDSLAEGYTETAHIIKHISPTVDAVPVVRCEDCLFWESGENECKSWGRCKMLLHCAMPPHAFCNFGVRKDDLPDDA